MFGVCVCMWFNMFDMCVCACVWFNMFGMCVWFNMFDMYVCVCVHVYFGRLICMCGSVCVYLPC